MGALAYLGSSVIPCTTASTSGYFPEAKGDQIPLTHVVGAHLHEQRRIPALQEHVGVAEEPGDRGVVDPR